MARQAPLGEAAVRLVGGVAAGAGGGGGGGVLAIGGTSAAAGAEEGPSTSGLGALDAALEAARRGACLRRGMSEVGRDPGSDSDCSGSEADADNARAAAACDAALQRVILRERDLPPRATGRCAVGPLTDGGGARSVLRAAARANVQGAGENGGANVEAADSADGDEDSAYEEGIAADIERQVASVRATDRSLAPPSALVYLKMDVLDASDHAVGPPHFKAEPDARFADDDGAGGTLKLLHGARYALRLKLEPDRLEPAGSGVEVWAEDELVCALPLVRGRASNDGAGWWESDGAWVCALLPSEQGARVRLQVRCALTPAFGEAALPLLAKVYAPAHPPVERGGRAGTESARAPGRRGAPLEAVAARLTRAETADPSGEAGVQWCHLIGAT